MLMSEQVALGQSSRQDIHLQPADANGTVRSYYFNFKTKEKILKGETVHLCDLRPGIIRIHGQLGGVKVSGNFDIGYLDYIDGEGGRVISDPKYFSKNGLDGVFKTQTGLSICATAKTAMKEGAAIEGVIYYTGN